MRCFYVLIHGELRWRTDIGADSPEWRPNGFYCHRYVLASGRDDAVQRASVRVRRNLDEQMGWLSRRQATLELDAEEVAPAPIHKLLKRDNRGHTFY